MLFVDAAGVEHKIIGGIVNEDGEKQFQIAEDSEVDISEAGLIKSPISYKVTEIKGVSSDVNILLGIHSKEALFTKYMYVIVKYFLLSRKADLINRDFFVSSYKGSDFTRNLEYEGDIVYSRFLTISGKTQDDWKGEDIPQVDNIEVVVAVPGNEPTPEDLGPDDSTVQPTDNLDC
jgi:hypothetical protein